MKKSNNTKTQMIDSLHKRMVYGGIFGFPPERLIYANTIALSKKMSLDELYAEYVTGKKKKGK